MTEIDKGVRLTNYVIDYTVIALLSYTLILLFTENRLVVYASYIVMFGYYFILESIFGQTLGKLATKTAVVHRHGGKAHVLLIFVRSALRFIPIDVMSYLFGTELGLHDVMSFTKLTKKKILEETKV